MPLLGILTALRRRWYVVVAGLLGSLLLASQGAEPHGAYETTASMLFFPPVSTLSPNGYATPGGSVITTAGFVAVRMRAPEVKAHLAARGAVPDYTVVMHNSGSQFADNFDRAAIDIAVSGPDAAATSRTMRLIAAEITDQLVAAQRRAGVVRREWVRTHLSPDDPPVRLVPGSPARAVAGSLLLGASGTFLAAVALDDRLRRRSLRRAAAHDLPVPVP